ncbi:hypothetical protein ETAA8_65750 [Anatilimnocola aggregata]|uniref:Uncharacterized protein n=1 Tax=Anatilimnocola aggregata TaxID=2528021 RepID=A0A517YMG1_9BACT|nr:hypothetical protein [Anatilimnocola aggregata]QDU31418.1 hypothetical protein ETAA8_65750 [Anatilimnocola aggregata]
MNLNQLLSLIELSEASAIYFHLAGESNTFKLTLHYQDRELVRDGLEFSLDVLRESDDVGQEIAEYAEVAAANPTSRITVELPLVPIVDYIASSGATDLTMRREGDSVAIVRLASKVAGHDVAYYFAINRDSVLGIDEASVSQQDRALYALSVAFRKTLFEAKQNTFNPVGFEGELILENSPILCLGGPKDGERVTDAGPFLRLATLGQVYEKRWFRSAGIERAFYVHAGISDAAAAALARAVMTAASR